MAIFKCKMCGGALEITENESVATCDYCGTQQTVPSSSDENIQGLFNRANILRMKSEFDKAEQIYEKIIQVDSTQAEAYWGLILCKFGIEYVEDPATFKRIPTCHRTSFDSIIADDDYKSALNYADAVQKNIYETEAKEIDRLQKEIIALSQKEEPYDVFLCYKETDETGKRTQDSVIANDIYYQLTQEGFKVFYAAITLENKLGSAYEPCIFAALNSAKVMLAIGTKPEYFNAVWVKNEWSRFLKMMKKDRSRVLIPCYKDMDAYELPEEFAHLQAQDMSKIGFINDVVRGIKKIINTEEPKAAVVKETVVTSNASAAPLLKRAFMFLEDGDWSKADDFCEQVLNLEPENAEAYLGKLMAEMRVRKQEALKDCAEPFDNSNNYQKVMRFGDAGLKESLTEYIEYINDRNENARKEGLYTHAKELMNSGNTQKDLRSAIRLFQKITGYRDVDELIVSCEQLLEEKKAEDEERKRKEEEKQADFNATVAKLNGVIAARNVQSFALRADGTVLAAGNNYDGQCDVDEWTGIIAISAGTNHTVGLQADGTVVAVGKNSSGQCNVSGWKNIVAVSAGEKHTVGLRSDGTVVAVGNNKYGQCDVSDWRDIIAVGAGEQYTIGLRKNGTVIAAGPDHYGRFEFNVSKWQNIVAVSAGEQYAVGLRSNGHVVATGADVYGACNVRGWKNIVAVSAGDLHTVGLCEDGTVVTAGSNSHDKCNVDLWKNIVAISAGCAHTIGLQSDGTVVAVGSNKYGQCNVHGKKLFDNIETFINECEQNKEKNREIMKQKTAWRDAGVCQYCGGIFKGLFTKKCTSCGKEKDY